MMKQLFLLALVALALLLGVSLPTTGQQNDSGAEAKKEAKKAPPLTQSLPERERSAKEEAKRDKALFEELASPYKKWLEEDVAYIISPEERSAFLHLNNDQEREQFIEQFWLRRDPTPDTVENEFKEEHYRRIAYANERFSSGTPGWLTDRGRVYIAWGPPDTLEGHPGGGPYERPISQGGGQTTTYPFEVWHYRYLPGIGQNVELEFVDDTVTGEYRLVSDPAVKDALLYMPGGGKTILEDMGMASRVQRFSRMDGTRVPVGLDSDDLLFDQQAYERMRTVAMVMAPPPVKFTDLEAMVDTKIRYNLLPFDLRVDYLRITDETILVPITISLQKKDLTYKEEEGVEQAEVNLFGRVRTLTGRIVQTFEDPLRLSVPQSLFEQTLLKPVVYQKALPLRPGLYKLELVLKDLNSGNVGTLERRLRVPRFEDDQLSHSSLILADLIERVPASRVGQGEFVIGDLKIRPVVNDQFRTDERMGIYLQVYNLGVDPKIGVPDATIEYVVHDGDKALFSYAETTKELAHAGRQITLEKQLPLGSFAPGKYQLQIKVTDHLRQQVTTSAAEFEVVQ